MHATRKGQQVYFGMKAHIGVDAHSGLVHHVLGTAAHISDVTVADHWLHGQEQMVHADAGYQGVAKRPEHHKRPVDWQVRRHRIGVLPGQEEAMLRAHRLKERAKAAIRAKVEHVFRTVKCQFGFTKVRYKGLAKNTAQLFTLFTLANLWKVRKMA
jgi:transposase, IS5 family